MMWLWMPSMLLAAFNAYALGLGELHVNSKLGGPLDVRVDLLELRAAEARDLKIRQAGFEEYRNHDAEYPAGVRFQFQLVNKRGKQPPYIHVFTREYVNEPFLTLLLEVSSPSGKIIKDYTFLIDPPHGWLITVPSLPKVPAQQTQRKRGAAEADSAKRLKTGRSSRSGEGASKRRSSAGESSYPGMASGDAARGANPFASLPGNSLKLTMSTSLSISRAAPGEPGADMSADALQEELIAKEKAVAELKDQISEMQAVIKILQLKLAVQTDSAAPAPGMLAQSGAPAAPATQPETPQKVAKPASGKVAAPPSVWPKVLLVIVLLALFAGAFFWFYRRREGQQPQRGLFEDLVAPVESMIHQRVKTGEAETTEKDGEQSLKTPANKELKTVPFTAREYDFLEQAEIYLRFGHDKLAEDVLREAIRINPLNPHGYLTLLGIYETRGDKTSFYTLAQQLKAIGDVDEWKNVAETGRKLDPDNPFYRA